MNQGPELLTAPSGATQFNRIISILIEKLTITCISVVHTRFSTI